jgi:hypothetical protein
LTAKVQFKLSPDCKKHGQRKAAPHGIQVVTCGVERKGGVLTFTM